MKKGFTLLELIIVIIILGVLATLGLTQYGRMVERARGAEAKAILGDIRKFAAAYYLEYADLSSFGDTEANIGGGADQIPGPAGGNCRPSHYFSYAIATTASTVTATATRCAAGGKIPQGGTAAGNTVQLVSDMTTGVDTWSGDY